MKLNIQPRSDVDADTARWYREIAQQLNGLSEGKIAASYQAITAAPTTGTFMQGDFVTNSAPAELGSALSKYVILGWVCVAAGTPGTWVQSISGNMGDGSTRSAFSVWQGDMANPVAGATITYNSTSLNTGSSMNLTTGLYTAPVAGLYHFTFSGFKNTTGVASIVFIVNGVAQIPRSYSSDGAQFGPHSLATTRLMAAGDTIGVRVVEGALHGNSSNEFSGFLVAAS